MEGLIKKIAAIDSAIEGALSRKWKEKRRDRLQTLNGRHGEASARVFGDGENIREVVFNQVLKEDLVNKIAVFEPFGVCRLDGRLKLAQKLVSAPVHNAKTGVVLNLIPAVAELVWRDLCDANIVQDDVGACVSKRQPEALEKGEWERRPRIFEIGDIRG